MRTICAAIILLAILGARTIGSATLGARPAVAEDARRVLPDSVTILMFAAFTPSSVEISSTGGLTAGRASLGRKASIGIVQGKLELNGMPAERCEITAGGDGYLRLDAAGRSRTLRGTVRIRERQGSLRITARMARRDYLAAALTAEASPNDPIEYLTALSVLQNNYLLFHSGRHAPDADLCDNTHCQLANMTARSASIIDAVDRAGHISLGSGDGLPCYYSVNCGGSTLTPGQVWNHAEPGYANVVCNHCRGSARYRWRRTFQVSAAASRIIDRTGPAPFVDDDFKIGLGRIVGFNNVLSNTISSIERRGSVYVIEGKGFGHRIGLCQEGARQLAMHGRSAAAILRFYFPAATVAAR